MGIVNYDEVKISHYQVVLSDCLNRPSLRWELEGRHQNSWSAPEMALQKIRERNIPVSSSVLRQISNAANEEKTRRERQQSSKAQASLQAQNEALAQSLRQELPIVYDSVLIGCGNVAKRWLFAYRGKEGSFHLNYADEKYYFDSTVRFPKHLIPGLVQ